MLLRHVKFSVKAGIFLRNFRLLHLEVESNVLKNKRKENKLDSFTKRLIDTITLQPSDSAKNFLLDYTATHKQKNGH